MIFLPLVIPLLRLAAARRSIAAVEFALLAPVFIIVLAGTVDLGFAIYTWSRLQGALAAGANYALMNPSAVNHTSAATLAQNLSTLVANSNTNTGNAPATVTVTVNNGPWNTATPVPSNPGYSLTYATGGTATNADNYYCLSGSPTSWTWGSSVAYGSACADASLAGQFVTIVASYDFTPFFPKYGFIRGNTITGGVAVQTK